MAPKSRFTTDGFWPTLANRFWSHCEAWSYDSTVEEGHGTMRRHLNDDQRSILGARFQPELSRAARSSAGKQGGRGNKKSNVEKLSDSVSDSFKQDTRTEAARKFSVPERKLRAASSIQKPNAINRIVAERKSAEALAAKAEPLNGHGTNQHGKPSGVDNVNSTTGGNSAEYLTARIARDRPDILERMKAGEFKSNGVAACDPVNS